MHDTMLHRILTPVTLDAVLDQRRMTSDDIDTVCGTNTKTPHSCFDILAISVLEVCAGSLLVVSEHLLSSTI